MNNEPTYIPLGTRCSPAVVLKHLGLRKEALPFDWIDCPLEQIAEFIKQEPEHIKGYLQTYFKDVDRTNFRHRFDGTWFPMDFNPINDDEGHKTINEADFNDVVDKYVVRFKRLHQLLFHAPKLVFLTIMPFYMEENVGKYIKLEEQLLKKVKGSYKLITVNVLPLPGSAKNMLNLNVELTDNFDVFNAAVVEKMKSEEVQSFIAL